VAEAGHGWRACQSRTELFSVLSPDFIMPELDGLPDFKNPQSLKLKGYGHHCVALPRL